jgi:hypothetical protein
MDCNCWLGKFFYLEKNSHIFLKFLLNRYFFRVFHWSIPVFKRQIPRLGFGFHGPLHYFVRDLAELGVYSRDRNDTLGIHTKLFLLKEERCVSTEKDGFGFK